MTSKPDDHFALVIDDDPATQEIVCSALCECGFAVAAFATAPTALAALDQRAPELIFLDVALSQSDAIDVLNGLGQRGYEGLVHLMSGGRAQLIAGVQRLGARQGVRFGKALGKPVSREAILEAAGGPRAQDCGAEMHELARSQASPADVSPEPAQPLADKFFAIRIAGRPCALRLCEIAGLVADKKIVRAPSREAALRGVAGFRGLVLPVYDLQELCGFSPAAALRWCAIASAAPIVFAFETFERQIGDDPDAELRPLDGPDLGGARLFLHTRAFSGPVFHLPTFIDALALRAAGAPQPELRA